MYTLTLNQIFEHIVINKPKDMPRIDLEYQKNNNEIHILIKNLNGELIDELYIREGINNTDMRYERNADATIMVIKFPPKNDYKPSIKILDDIISVYRSICYLANVAEHPINRDFYDAHKKHESGEILTPRQFWGNQYKPAKLNQKNESANISDEKYKITEEVVSNRWVKYS